MNAFPDQIHLTDDQLDDHLIGDLAPAPSAHLAACTLCADRVAAASFPLASFHQVSTSWSERRSATLPIPSPTQQRPGWQRHTAWATASLSVAFGLACINATHQFSFPTTPDPAIARTSPAPQLALIPPAATLSQAATPAPAQLSADNHMLRAIDASLNPAADSPASLGLTPAAAPSNGPPNSLQD
jgi:hypothetical protein